MRANGNFTHIPSTSTCTEVKPPPVEKDPVTDIVVEENIDCINVEVLVGDNAKEEIVEVRPEAKRFAKQEYFSDNSVSLPGLMGQHGPVSFEPGIFKKEGDPKHKADLLKLKKKRKDKKKHKHTHKHKHDHKNKDKQKKDKDPNKLKIKEETLSSVSSTPSPNSHSLGDTL